MAKTKIAILGGGLGSMAAAYELTCTDELRDRFEVTVYQQGWRLGGKAASGRNHAAGERIEEHGAPRDPRGRRPAGDHHAHAGRGPPPRDRLSLRGRDRPLDRPRRLGGAHVCEIYTDVDGVYTADPRICPNGRKIDRISYEEMLELGSMGAKVLQIRSVEVAMKYGVPVHVRTSFSESMGTMVTKEDASLESIVVTGVTSDANTAKVTIRGVVDQPGIAAAVFESLAQRHVSVDMIIQNVSEDGRTDLTFTVTQDDSKAACEIAAQALIEKREVLVDPDVVKVSIVGLGMRSHAGVAARMFRLLGDARINIQAISTSEIKVSCLIEAQHAKAAVRTLHDGFELGEPRRS